MLKKRSYTLIAKILGLCCLLSIVSCNKHCQPKHKQEKSEASFLLKKVKKNLMWDDKNIHFMVVRNPKSDTNEIPNEKLILRLTRKEGKLASIPKASQHNDGIFDFSIHEEDLDKEWELPIAIDEKKEKKVVFELELIYEGNYIGKSKTVTWQNKHIKLSIDKLSKKLVGNNKALKFTIKDHGSDSLDEGGIVLRFTRKSGQKASIKGTMSLPIHEIVTDNQQSQTGVFELPIKNEQLNQPLDGLTLDIEEGEREVIFELQLAYQGYNIGKPAIIKWQAEKVNLSLHKVSKELRGDNKEIIFSIKKGIFQKPLTKPLFLRITRVLDTNATIIGAPQKGKANAYELPIPIDKIDEGPFEGLKIDVAKEDTIAKFKLQLVYDQMDVGDAKEVTWRLADVKLELKDVKKKLVGDEDQQLQFVIKDQGKDRPYPNKTKLRLIRLVNTNATIENAELISPGIYEIAIPDHKIDAIIDNLKINTAKGDTVAKFNLQIFYDGLEMGKPCMVTWEAKKIKLALKHVSNHLVGDHKDIKFTVVKKGHFDPDTDKPILLRLTRQEGYNATINGGTIRNNEDGVFELPIAHDEIGSAIEKLTIEPRQGELKAEFLLQLVYDGMNIGKTIKLVWEAEHVNLSIDQLTDALRGDNKKISFVVKNHHQKQPEKNVLFLRITRKQGYGALINGALDKHDGLFELPIDTNLIGSTIDNISIQPIEGEMKAVFKLQLVYDGKNIGHEKKVVWVEKDVQPVIQELTKKLQGDNKTINFKIQNKGKDAPEEGKLFIRFKRQSGYKAKIIRNGSMDIQETGVGFYEFPLSSNVIGSTLTEFTIIPREGETAAAFTVQMVYDGKEIGKPAKFTWKQKSIGLSLKNVKQHLRGHEENGTTLSFMIARKSFDDKPENKLEENKLMVRLTKRKGNASISAKNKAVDTITSFSEIYEFPISSTQINSEIKNLCIVPEPEETEAIFDLELVYDSKKIGKSIQIQWKSEDIRPELFNVKHHIEQKLDEKPIIEFAVKNKGKDQMEEGKLFLRLKRKKGFKTGILANGQALQENHGMFEYQLDVKKLNVIIHDLQIDAYLSDQEIEFEVQLVYNAIPIGKAENIVCRYVNTSENQEK